MNLFVTLYVALLFVVLTPGVLLSLPPKGSKLVVAATHGLVFALVYHLTHKYVWKLSMSFDGFQNMMKNEPFQNMMKKNESFQNTMGAPPMGPPMNGMPKQ
jgi:hypothetical protein